MDSTVMIGCLSPFPSSPRSQGSPCCCTSHPHPQDPRLKTQIARQPGCWDASLGYRWESWGITICCVHGIQSKKSLQGGSLSAGDRAGAICHSSPPFCHQVCHLLLLSGDTNDEHVLNSFVYLATAFLRGGLN